MSKAFTRESDDSGDDGPPLLRPQLPPGASNLITAAGAQRLRHELAVLLDRKQQLTNANANSEGIDSSQGDPRQLQARIRQLQQILQSVVVAELPDDRGLIGFGARVT